MLIAESGRDVCLTCGVKGMLVDITSLRLSGALGKVRVTLRQCGNCAESDSYQLLYEWYAVKAMVAVRIPEQELTKLYSYPALKNSATKRLPYYEHELQNSPYHVASMQNSWAIKQWYQLEMHYDVRRYQTPRPKKAAKEKTENKPKVNWVPANVDNPITPQITSVLSNIWNVGRMVGHHVMRLCARVPLLAGLVGLAYLATLLATMLVAMVGVAVIALLYELVIKISVAVSKRRVVAGKSCLPA